MELIIVVMILGIAAAFIVPRFEALTGQGAEARAVRLITGAVSRAQDLAVIRKTPLLLSFDLDQRTLLIAGSAEKIELPDIAFAFLRPPGSDRRTVGTVEITVDRFGEVELFELEVGRELRCIANPITGAMEVVTNDGP